MMFNLANVFNKQDIRKAQASRDRIAELLQTSPEALDAFEATYAATALNEISDNFYQVNSRQASAIRKSQAEGTVKPENMIQQIINELINKTQVYSFDGNLNHSAEILHPLKALPGTEITNQDINQLPEAVRPQLTGSLMKVDIKDHSSQAIMSMYDMSVNGKTEKLRSYAYHQFRQGLDILDLDPLTYAIINQNKNSMGYWLPHLIDACRGQDFFKIPATKIAKVPMTMLQLTRQEYTSLTPTTIEIVDKWAHEVFQLDDNRDYFIKTGTYSSKFDFRNAKVTGAKEVQELGEYLLFIHFQALQMASPLAQPCIYGASTTTEWVVRDYIQDKENNPCIYKGMPLHTEYRVFIDADRNEILTCVPYWEPETMKNRFNSGAEHDNIHDAHDYVIYKAHEPVLMARYEVNKATVCEKLAQILPSLNLQGQWSIDIMQNGDDFYIIDMGVAEQSAFYDHVPAELRKPMAETWMPKIET